MTRDGLPPESEMPRVYRDWLDHLSREDDNSEATRKTYGQGFRRVLHHAEIHPSLFEPSLLDEATLAQAARSMLSSGKKVKTVKTTLAAVQHFCQFCKWSGRIDELPNFEWVRRTGIGRASRIEERTDPDHYSEGDLRLLYAAARAPLLGGERVRWPERDITMCRFLANLGLRGQELCDANCDWIRHERYVDTNEASNWTLHVQGEGSRRRQVPAPNWILLEVSDRWEQSRSERFGVRWPEGPLFVTNDGERFKYTQLRYLIDAVRKDAELRPLPLKAFRQSAQIQWENLGLTASEIRRLLGNSKPDWL